MNVYPKAYDKNKNVIIKLVDKNNWNDLEAYPVEKNLPVIDLRV
ncbi:hypothetical protein LEP1GSC108_0813 [Leptospira weilii str. UI 13098]|uniref:Uncharacterized protein n=1 Tax=Leptospira weilii str. UI 13098 TaxID=1088542 RepID=M6Q5S6_9LEPT|nr:hypothetical protein LEP1GSC108_0813 [Leptospira weilii str. UI 13098]